MRVRGSFYSRDLQRVKYNETFLPISFDDQHLILRN